MLKLLGLLLKIAGYTAAELNAGVNIAAAALNVADVDALKAAQINGKAVETVITDAIAKIGENMTLRRAAQISVGKGAIGSYIHNTLIDGLGTSPTGLRILDDGRVLVLEHVEETSTSGL